MDLGRVKRLWRSLIDLQPPLLQLRSSHSANFGCFVSSWRVWCSEVPVRTSTVCNKTQIAEPFQRIAAKGVAQDFLRVRMALIGGLLK